MNQNSRQLDAAVIGAGQAGLAAGYHLARTSLRFEILDGAPRVGDAWRHRWDSLELFTPAQHDGLPRLPFPAPRNTFPGKEAFADYLEDYAEHFRLPVRTGVRVERVSRAGGSFAVETASGTVLARNVIVAAGANALPRIPGAAAGLDPAIRQLHSSQYRSPAEIPDGDVLVVGAGTSGSEIALELAGTRRVLLSGRPTPHIPDPLLRYTGGVYWRFIHSVLTLSTPVGRKVAADFHRRGAPLIRISPKDLDRAGVERVPRMTGTADGQPVFDGGSSAAVRTVIWATGYLPDLGWIDGLELAPSGWPLTRRGAAPGTPGLFFVGMPFQYALTSGLIGGVDRDAAYVVRQLARRVPAPSVVAPVFQPRDGDSEHQGGGEAQRAGGGHAGPQ
ncbi:flavin-containing monooxygenase [Arthrobacter sp. EPSL27]|uniref:flavin-containing monooxygenase n=1 Tax=Arthrobacter sp. EPSL27 TaxID=1745378 RepID=UPI00074A63E8|nr:NAD(P)-binding domain-containing protein [Arthrobacter sp. EPSL27]KUM33369.1 potassium transporter Trk [Arthrobacter sp. EPSL27]